MLVKLSLLLYFICYQYLVNKLCVKWCAIERKSLESLMVNHIRKVMNLIDLQLSKRTCTHW